MLERIRESLRTLWRMFLLSLVFIPPCVVIVIIGCVIAVVTGTIMVITVPCVVLEYAAMFFWWIFTGKTWKEAAADKTGFPLWSAMVWREWIGLLYRIEGRFL